MVFKNKEWLHVYSYLFIYFVSFSLKKKKHKTLSSRSTGYSKNLPD